MWKEFLYFSRNQRIGIVVLIILILSTLTLNIILPFLIKEKKVETNFINEARSFNTTLILRDSLKEIERMRKYKEKYQNHYFIPGQSENFKYQLFTFDPNKADSSQFTKLGIKSYVASNIVKYRKKGGFFRSKEDFSKVYGITAEKYAELSPFIIISENITKKNDSISTIQKIQKISIQVDINCADTTQLMQIKGIGRYYANGIIRFRNATGGFVFVEQLMEINGMRAEIYDIIKPYCIININHVKKIKVNIASIEKLNSHLYINFYQAKAIYELRRKKGKLLNINELKELSEFTEASLNKVKPYLSFE